MPKRSSKGMDSRSLGIRLLRIDRDYLEKLAAEDNTSLAGAVGTCIARCRGDASLDDEFTTAELGLLRYVRRKFQPMVEG